MFPGAVLFTTRRVHKRQFLLRPSKKVNQIIEYILAVLAERHGILLHAICILSNHGHDVSTDPEGKVVEFRRERHAPLRDSKDSLNLVRDLGQKSIEPRHVATSFFNTRPLPHYEDWEIPDQRDKASG